MRRVITRTAIGLMVALAAALAAGAPLHAETYPSRAITIISPHPVGVATDILARALGDKLSAALKQPIVVENRPGANGVIAEGAVAKAAPDGYTLLITSGAHIANAFTVKKLPYDVIKDFAPVTQLAASYGLALITNLPVKSVADLVALAKKKPGQLTFATNGVGNVTHVAGLLFDARTGVNMIAVPYNTPNLITDVMTGQVDMAFYSVASAAPLVNAGKIKALALTGSRRAPALPDTPTLQELGYKDFDVTGYFGLLFPAGTPRARIDAIYRASKDALSSPQLKRVFDVSGMYAVGSSPEEFAAFLKQDYQYQDKLMGELGLKVK
ncbi:MAG TPA: tripartite tricarboxylate transporter substrate-binding protein [Rhizomicrobium sp.]|jgi:tripartite-type tricarboxylate transporter receptor subunit TctC